MKRPTLDENINKTEAYVPGKPLDEFLLEKGIAKCIKLDANENPYGYSKSVFEALNNQSFNRYPDGGCTILRNQLALGLKLSPDNILISGGSNHIVDFVLRGFLREGHNVITAEKSFSLYRLYTAKNGGEFIETPLIDGYFDLNEIKNNINDKTDVVFICNPNNPTGTVLTREQIEQFLVDIDERILVVVDEAYVEFCDEYSTVVDLISKFPNLLVTRTFSKIFGLAGFRIGYAVGSKSLIMDLNKIVVPFSVSMPALVAASASLNDTNFLQETYSLNLMERKKMETFFNQKEWFTFPSQTNFIFVRIPIKDVKQKLEEKGILIRSLKSFGFNDNEFRITIGRPEENEKFRFELERLLL